MGYIGNKRSERSAEAIEAYEVPMALINGDTLADFITDLNLPDELTEKVEALPCALWRWAAGKAGAASWHHTGKYFQATNHYDLYEAWELLQEKGLQAAYKEYKADARHTRQLEKKYIKNNSGEYCYIKVEEWGGTRRHPKIIGYSEKCGIKKGDWLYYSEKNKYKIDARKVKEFAAFEKYTDLTKNYPQFKHTKKRLNQIKKAIL